MRNRRTESWGQRDFLGGLALAGTAGLLGLQPALVAARFMVDKGYAQRYDYALEVIKVSPIASGVSTTLRIRCASTPCAYMRSA
jgi:hypothetical protein